MDISDEIATLGIEMQMQMNRSERRRHRKQQCCNCWKSFLAFLFSHIGLAAMVVAYSIMGGFLFQALEAPYELKVRFGIREWKEMKIEEIYNLAAHLALENLQKDNFTERVRKIFLEFQTNVTRHVKDNGWDGNDDTEEASLQWSFAGALLYAVTVITTIGYGHVAPKTTWGRLLTIVYALVGIPLTFLYLSNIGNFMADCFRLFYKNICCDLCCCQRCERKRKRERAIARRRKAAQRNSLLRQPSDVGYQAQDEMDPECHSLRDEIPLAIEDISPDEQTEEDHNGAQNNDDIEQAAGGTGDTLPPPYQALVTDETLPVRETAILDDNIDDDDGIKETAILDSDTDDDTEDKAKNSDKTPQTPIIDWDNIENFADARETAILDDEDDDDEEGVFLPTSEALPAPALNGGASDDMDTIPLASATDEANEEDTLSRKRKRDKSRSKSREKREQKQAEKKKEKERKEKEKKERERLKREKKEAEKESKKNKKVKRDRSKEKKGESEKSHALLPESMENSAFAHDEADNTLSKDSRQNSKPADEDITVSDSSKSNDKSKTSGDSSIQDSKKSKVLSNDQNDACADGAMGCDAKDTKHKKDSDKRKNSDKKKESDKKQVKGKLKERPSSLKEKTRFDDKVTMLGKKSRDKPTSRSLKEPPHSILKDRSPSRKGAEGLSPSIATPTTMFPLPHPSGLPVHNPPAKEGKLSRGKSTKKSFKRKDAQKAMQRREIMKMLILEGARREMLKQQSKSSSNSHPTTKRSFSAEDMNHLASTSSDLKNTGAHYASDESFVTAKSESFGQDDSPSSPDLTTEKFLPENDVVTTQPDSVAVSIDQSPYDLFDLSKDSGALGYDDPFDFGESEQQEKVTVPISICLIIIAAYIFGGSMLFALWEEWDYLTGSYFCFITLSTIGFGDIVPGTDVSDWGSHEKLVLCALWLAFGLSLLAMCFNLMQEEVKEKCKWVGQKLGLLRDDDDA